MKFQDDRVFKEKIIKVTVSRTKSSNYYISILIERKMVYSPKTTISLKKIQAFDMSFPNFLVSSQNKMKNPRFYRNEEKKLKRLNRELSRKKYGSNNYYNSKIQLARKYEKIYNRKLDWTHKISHLLAHTYDVIILEDLNIIGMKKHSKGYAKSVTLDFSWYQFVTKLRYKLEQQGNYLIFVDRFFPSSKQCSHCGWKNTNLKLSDRIWICRECEEIHDRDKNASKNLFNEGLKHLKNLPITLISTVGTTESHAYGDDVRLSLRKQLSMKQESTAIN